MISKIKEAAKIKIDPIAMIFSNEKPKEAVQLKEGGWTCAMTAVASVTKGKTVVFDKNTCGCVGAGTGFGFGNQYNDFPGGRECCHYFFTIGNDKWEYGRKQMIEFGVHDKDDFVQGVGFLKTPEHAKHYIDNLPITTNDFKYMIFKPLSEVDENIEVPQIIVFLIDMDQLSGLVTLANYERVDSDGTIIPCCSACQSIGIYPIKELESPNPRAVVGLVDPTARVFLKKILKNDYLTFAVPYSLYKTMESNVAGSLFEKATWQKLMNMNV